MGRTSTIIVLACFGIMAILYVLVPETRDQLPGAMERGFSFILWISGVSALMLAAHRLYLRLRFGQHWPPGPVLLKKEQQRLRFHLNGWQRLGIVATVGWIGFVGWHVIAEVANDRASGWFTDWSAPQPENWWANSPVVEDPQNRNDPKRGVKEKARPEAPKASSTVHADREVGLAHPGSTKRGKSSDPERWGENDVEVPPDTVSKSPNPFDDLIPAQAPQPRVRKFNLGRIAGAMFLPPVFVWCGAWVLLVTIRWVARGFRQPRKVP